MQELEDDGLDVDEFIKIIRTYEQQVEQVWERFDELRKEGLNK